MPTAQETKAALARADKVVTLSPARGQRTYVNKAVIAGGTLCRIEEKDEHLIADAAKGIGGGDEAVHPGMLMRAALTSCMAIGIKLWAARRDIPVETVEVTLEADADARGVLGLCDTIPPGFTGLRARVEVRSPADPAAVEAMVAMALRYSPMLDAMAHAQTIETVTRIAPSGEAMLAAGGDHGR